jgi:hypothetical protein
MFVTAFNDIPFSITNMVFSTSLIEVKNILDPIRHNVKNSPNIESRLLLLLITMKKEKLILL